MGSIVPETPHQRTFFYVGGEYTTSTAGETTFQHQMYVEKLTPRTTPIQELPIIFVHGNGQSGTNWLTKPDSSPGWASFFLSQGYVVYIVDQPHVGRSPLHPGSDIKTAAFSVQLLQERFTAPKKYGLWDEAALHTQWPGSGLQGDPIFDRYYTSTLSSPLNTPVQERYIQAAGIALLDKIGPSILITHSQGALAGYLWSDSRPELVRALVQIEPKGPPFREVIFADVISRPWGLTSIPLRFEGKNADGEEREGLRMCVVNCEEMDNGSRIKKKGAVPCILQEEPAKQLVNLKEIPILVVTGEASYHAPYDTHTVGFLRQAGCSRVDHLELGREGIHGNGHLLIMEKNSDDIAVKIDSWVKQAIEKE